MRKILMHTCCAPCFTYIYEDMTNYREIFTKDFGDIDITSFYYNPNIHPKSEFERRKKTLIDFCNMKNCKLVTSDYYDLHEFVSHDKMHEGFVSRCNYCYHLRLKAAFEYAKNNGFDTVMTTLSISPYQNQDLIRRVGKELEKEYGIEYIHLDYTVKFREGQKMAKDLGLYRQKYCGCVFSMEESTSYNHNNLKLSLPEGYKLPKIPRLQVKKIENKEDYMDLFLKGDPSKDMIHKYLDDSDVYALKKEDEIICIAVILHIDRKTLELKNIVTKEEYRGKGYAKILLKSLCGNYKQKYSKMIVGVAENNIPFYVKQGFDKYEKTIKNFFVDNYDKEIKDGDFICTDMIYYSKDLRRR